MKLVQNETREKIVETLKGATEPMTLAEIAQAIGKEKIGSGTTNPMVTAGVIRKVGTKRVAKTTYVEVATYAIGEEKAEEKTEEVKA